MIHFAALRRKTYSYSIYDRDENKGTRHKRHKAQKVCQKTKT